MVTRMLPPSSGNATHKVNGRIFQGVIGVTQDIADWDAAELAASGWTSLGTVGTSAMRPTTNLVDGQSYQDKDLGVPIFWDAKGKVWRHAHTAAVV
jgi:hypothetical protein